MSIATQGYVPKDVSIQGSTNNKITNLSIPLLDTEVSLLLQTNVKQIILKPRTKGAIIKLAFTLGESGTKYFTVNYGSVFSLQDISFFSTTLYLQSNINSSIVEILELY
jgi:hypothetical protein